MENGIISELSKYRGFGKILDKNEEEVFFHYSSLSNIYFKELHLGDHVEFRCILTPKGYNALQVRKVKPKKTFAGINRKLVRSHFLDEENAIIDSLAKIFYITNGGREINLGTTSKYRYTLIKPTSKFSEQFNLNREIIVLFSPYSTFESRTLDAIDKIYSLHESLRIDRICSIIISKDPNVEERIAALLKDNAEMQVVIPFSYNEILSNGNEKLINNRFRNHFFERDLFAFEAPLVKDLYFFGRRDYVQTLINRHFSGENSGVFGLRRSGKTSILNAIYRSLNLINGKWLLIDCQELHFKYWNNALFYIIESIALKYSIPLPHKLEDYDEQNTSTHFSRDMDYLHHHLGGKRILLLFDEIEHITFEVSLSKHWRQGDDYIKFWQIIRSYFQKNTDKLSFIIAGTNPMCIEAISINSYDNPMFNQLKTNSYIPAFDVKQTKEMVNKLGGYMGLSFDDIVCASLTHDFGGHPFLIRHYCSAINDYINEKGINKPLKVTKALYNKVMPIFEIKYAETYCSLILDVLKKHYNSEYIILEKLALEETTFYEEQIKNNQIISHLIGYGILEHNETIYGTKIDILNKYLRRKYKYQKLDQTNEEKQKEISERRNSVEPKLRKLVRNQLLSFHGEEEAKKKMIATAVPKRGIDYSNYTFEELFDPNKCNIFFSQLSKAIEDNWSCFKNIFSKSKKTVVAYMTIVNELRRDCHAAIITDEEMKSFRGAMSFLEEEVTKYFKSGV